MTEQRRHDQNWLFRRGYSRNRGYNPEKLSWVRVPMKVDLVPLKLDPREEWCWAKVLCIREDKKD